MCLIPPQAAAYIKSNAILARVPRRAMTMSATTALVTSRAKNTRKRVLIAMNSNIPTTINHPHVTATTTTTLISLLRQPHQHRNR